ncbi:MAG: ATP-binding cassette domain-containing protein [Casimicrobiaceae bacterium]|nr:ATP-binding cassette domain-containing protein [Casimicrobiaceae bacterium]MCX8097834.1 ATP-binding cassette domain-containing protein [Casimicrobiaceae bacterium]MDW8311376.1 ATP-binding cassette domain-containing protein [Burkholderiales bacterium]
MSAFVEVENLSCVFDVSPPWLNRLLEGRPKVFLHAVSEVSFTIQRGETLALVGESGCGKSTVARLIVGLYRPSAGRVRIDGIDVHRTPERSEAGRALRRKVQMIFQDPYASLNPRWRVADIIAEPIRTHRLLTDRAAIDKRVAELLGYVKLTARDGDKYPHQFSGGQRQRISIARALASHPEFLICDEPTSALDVSVQAQVLNLMKDLQREMGLTYLFISHNLQVVHHVSDRVGVMYLGRLVEIGDKRKVFSAPQHPYTRMLLDAIPDLKRTGKARTPVAGEVPNPLAPPPGCAFHPRCPRCFERCMRERPMLAPVLGRDVACHAAQQDAAVPTPLAL